MNRTAGAVPTQPLRAEHRHLLPHVDSLAAAGDAVGLVAPAELEARVVDAHDFLAAHLIPHARAEDEVLYPEVDRLLGSRSGTRPTDTMRRDHEEVVRLTERLGGLVEQLRTGAPGPAEEAELRRVLYGLHAVVGLHFAKEEEVYLPLLDRASSPAEVAALVERMERAQGGERR